jgi:hypothetical protein
MWTLVAVNGARAVWAAEAQDGSGFELYPAPVFDYWMGEARTMAEAREIAQTLVMNTEQYDRVMTS